MDNEIKLSDDKDLYKIIAAILDEDVTAAEFLQIIQSINED